MPPTNSHKCARGKTPADYLNNRVFELSHGDLVEEQSHAYRLFSWKSVDVHENCRRVYRLFRETNFSRVPVWDTEKKNIVGILYRADFYEELLAGHKSFLSVIRPVAYTQEGEKVSVLMKRMQTERVHMVMVGEAGNARGLITREDMIEELLGDVDDKYDMTPVTSPLQPVVPEQGGSEE